MITEFQIEIAKKLLATGLVNNVYHSAELVEDAKGVKYPAYKVGAEQYYIGPDDSKILFAYIRSSGPTTRAEEKLEGSCSKMYKLNSPHRIVLFQDHCKENFDAMTNKLLSVAFIKDVSLVSFSNNSFQLAKAESPIGDFAFDATTFYLAIDINIKLPLRASNCEEDICLITSNPIC